MGRRPAFWFASLLVVIVVAAAVLFDSLFDEPGARSIASLVDALGSRSVLGVFAHPDDEILVCATLADAVRHGCVVRTVTATRGERGIPKGFTGTESDLVQLRLIELRRSSERLGIREQLVWSFPDSGLSNIPIEILRDSVLAAVRRFQPDLIVTTDSTAGFTGHADHRRMGAAVLAAVTAPEGSPSSTPSLRWLAQITTPRRTAMFFPAAIRERLRRQPAATVAAASNSRIKLLVIEAHASQQQYFPPKWFRRILYYFYDREHFALTRLDRSLP